MRRSSAMGSTSWADPRHWYASQFNRALALTILRQDPELPAQTRPLAAAFLPPLYCRIRPRDESQ